MKGHYLTLNVGDSVTLVGSIRQGHHASLLAYALPLVLMLVVLFSVTKLYGESTGAFAALLTLALYYGALYLLRNRVGKHFHFEIETN